MGRTREQKAAADAALQRAVDKREAREAAAASLARRQPVLTLALAENALVCLAWLVRTEGPSFIVGGKRAIDEFDRLEKLYISMKRADELLQRSLLRTERDFADYFKRTKFLFEDRDSACE